MWNTAGERDLGRILWRLPEEGERAGRGAELRASCLLSLHLYSFFLAGHSSVSSVGSREYLISGSLSGLPTHRLPGINYFYGSVSSFVV